MTTAPVDQYDEMVRTEHLVLYISVRQYDAGFWSWAVGEWDGYEMCPHWVWFSVGMTALERTAWEQARARCETAERAHVAWRAKYERERAEAVS